MIQLAQSFNKNEVDALLSLGFIRKQSVHTAGVDVALGHATNEQILREIEKRVDPQSVRLFHGDGKAITPQD